MKLKITDKLKCAISYFSIEVNTNFNTLSITIKVNFFFGGGGGESLNILLFLASSYYILVIKMTVRFL